MVPNLHIQPLSGDCKNFCIIKAIGRFDPAQSILVGAKTNAGIFLYSQHFISAEFYEQEAGPSIAVFIDNHDTPAYVSPTIDPDRFVKIYLVWNENIGCLVEISYEGDAAIDSIGDYFASYTDNNNGDNIIDGKICVEGTNIVWDLPPVSNAVVWGSYNLVDENGVDATLSYTEWKEVEVFIPVPGNTNVILENNTDLHDFFSSKMISEDTEWQSVISDIETLSPMPKITGAPAVGVESVNLADARTDSVTWQIFAPAIDYADILEYEIEFSDLVCSITGVPANSLFFFPIFSFGFMSNGEYEENGGFQKEDSSQNSSAEICVGFKPDGDSWKFIVLGPGISHFYRTSTYQSTGPSVTPTNWEEFLAARTDSRGVLEFELEDIASLKLKLRCRRGSSAEIFLGDDPIPIISHSYNGIRLYPRKNIDGDLYIDWSRINPSSIFFRAGEIYRLPGLNEGQDPLPNVALSWSKTVQKIKLLRDQSHGFAASIFSASGGVSPGSYWDLNQENCSVSPGTNYLRLLSSASNGHAKYEADIATAQALGKYDPFIKMSGFLRGDTANPGQESELLLCSLNETDCALKNTIDYSSDINTLLSLEITDPGANVTTRSISFYTDEALIWDNEMDGLPIAGETLIKSHSYCLTEDPSGIIDVYVDNSTLPWVRTFTLMLSEYSANFFPFLGIFK